MISPLFYGPPLDERESGCLLFRIAFYSVSLGSSPDFRLLRLLFTSRCVARQRRLAKITSATTEGKSSFHWGRGRDWGRASK